MEMFDEIKKQRDYKVKEIENQEKKIERLLEQIEGIRYYIEKDKRRIQEYDILIKYIERGFEDGISSDEG